MAAAGPVPAELRAQSSLGTGMRSHRVASSGGREERRGRETQPKKGGPARKRHQGKQSDCNKEKEEEGRMRERGEGWRAGSPRERTGGADKGSAGSRQPSGPRAETRSDPARPTGSPRLADEVTACDRQGPRQECARGAERVTQLCTPKGRCPAPGAQSFSAPAPLPALNGSVIDWPRVLFSPRAAGARGWLISIFPAASPRSRSSCSRPPRRPRIYLRFNKKWEL